MDKLPISHEFLPYCVIEDPDSIRGIMEIGMIVE